MEYGKLIGLLNEYGEYDLVEHNGNICKRDTDDEGEINIYTDYTAIIISKKYGFIKWLVDNDKIDTEKVIDTAKSSVIDTYYYEEGIDDIYIPLLMVLAIQDEPIEYLLSVIK